MADHLLNVNLVSAVKVAELARRAGVGRFIYASTGSVYAASFQPLTEASPVRRDGWYAYSKLAAEEALALLRKDLDVTILRPFGIYGPGQTKMLVARLIDSIDAEQEITVQRRLQMPEDIDGLRVSLCYVDDAVRIIERLIEQSGPPVLNLAGPEPVSIRRLASEIGRQLGKQPRLRLVEANREGDLIADTSLLRASFPGSFTASHMAFGRRSKVSAAVAISLDPRLGPGNPMRRAAPAYVCWRHGLGVGPRRAAAWTRQPRPGGLAELPAVPGRCEPEPRAVALWSDEVRSAGGGVLLGA